MKRLACMFAGLSIIAIAGYDLSSSADQNNLMGKHYWLLTGMNDPNEPIDAVLELSTTEVVDGQYLCSGLFKVEEPLMLDFPTFGNWLHVQDEVRITLSVQGKRFDYEGNYTVGIGMYTLELDPNTLNGTSEGAEVHVDGVELYKFDCTYLGRELPTDPNS